MTIFREDGDSWGLQKSQIVNERGPSWDISRRQFVQVNIFSVIIAIIIIVVVIWTKAPPGRWLVHVIMRSHELIIAINYVVVVVVIWSKAPPGRDHVMRPSLRSMLLLLLLLLMLLLLLLLLSLDQTRLQAADEFSERQGRDCVVDGINTCRFSVWIGVFFNYFIYFLFVSSNPSRYNLTPHFLIAL